MQAAAASAGCGGLRGGRFIVLAVLCSSQQNVRRIRRPIGRQYLPSKRSAGAGQACCCRRRCRLRGAGWSCDAREGCGKRGGGEARPSDGLYLVHAHAGAECIRLVRRSWWWVRCRKVDKTSLRLAAECVNSVRFTERQGSAAGPASVKPNRCLLARHHFSIFKQTHATPNNIATPPHLPNSHPKWPYQPNTPSWPCRMAPIASPMAP